jgi:hypothetical protein
MAKSSASGMSTISKKPPDNPKTPLKKKTTMGLKDRADMDSNSKKKGSSTISKDDSTNKVSTKPVVGQGKPVRRNTVMHANIPGQNGFYL